MNETDIAWTEKTWNPLSGCTKISEGCAFCYAHTIAENKRGTVAFPKGFDLVLKPNKLKEIYKIKNSKVFVNSMSDLFQDGVPDSYIIEVFDAMKRNDTNIYQVLTKRPERMVEFSKTYDIPFYIWMGATVESQKRTNRIDDLRNVKSKIKFISFEPLLTEVDCDLNGIDWVIVGGESGFHIKNKISRSLLTYNNGVYSVDKDKKEWVKNIVNQCREKDIAVFFKQWGGMRPKSNGNELDGLTYEELPEWQKQKTLF
jgi:protein gp37